MWVLHVFRARKPFNWEIRRPFLLRLPPREMTDPAMVCDIAGGAVSFYGLAVQFEFLEMGKAADDSRPVYVNQETGCKGQSSLPKHISCHSCHGSFREHSFHSQLVISHLLSANVAAGPDCWRALCGKRVPAAVI